MKSSVSYALAGLALTGLAVWIIHNRYEGESLADNPLDEVDRMMSQTRQKLGELQQNLSDFRHVLTQATTLEQTMNSAPSA